jgi:hypothetical protein
MTFDRRTRFILYGVLVGVLALLVMSRFGVFTSDQSQAVSASESIPTAEKRLYRLRRIAATVQGKETVLKQANAELNSREAGILKAATEDQAKAQLLELTQGVAKSNGIGTPALEDFRERVLNNDYAEVWTTVTFTCGMEQLVNMLTALANQPQILATNGIRITGGNDKNKNVAVRLSVSGIVPRKLLPAKKGTATF